MTKQGILDAAKHLSIKQNVSIQVIDRITGKVVQEHIGHNQATNSMLFGIAHHLIGDFFPNETHGLNPGYSMLSNFVPRYISLGTMGLINQDQDAEGLPAGIGDSVPNSSDPEYQELLQAMNEAKEVLDAANAAMQNECKYWPATEECANCTICSDRIQSKKRAVELAQENYALARNAFLQYNEEARFVEYMEHVPGYGADGYSADKNNNRKWFGLGWPWSSYDVTSNYRVGDEVTYKGILYKCTSDTPIPASVFDTNLWEQEDDVYQPSLDTTINMELISPTFPRMDISYRDVVPEYEAEVPRTIDIVFSSIISTGALKQFRPKDNDYIFITEAGLWSKKTFQSGNENGLLAGYRIVPPNQENWDMHVPENRKILKENVLKVGVNQVVQVVWKIQIGSLAQLIPTKVIPDGDVPKYYDGKFLTITPSYFSTNVAKLIYSRLCTERSDDMYGNYPPTIPASFRRSTVKRGNPVPQVLTNTPELVYLDFEIDDDGKTQTVWWWTSSGMMTLQSSTMFAYWTYFTNQSTSSFYYIDVSNCYINTGVCNGWYGMDIYPDLGIDHVTIDVTNARLGPNFSTGLYSHGEYNKPIRLIGFDTAFTEQSSGSYIINSSELYGDTYFDNIIRGVGIKIGNVYKAYIPNSTIYCRNYILPQSYDYLMWLIDGTQNPVNIDVSNWDLSNCTHLGCLLSVNQEDQPITVYGLGTWDVSNITEMPQLFNRVTYINGSLANWDVSNVTDMSSMFSDTDWSRRCIESITNWDVSSCSNFSRMFFNYSSSNPGYADYSFLNSWNVSLTANFNQILPPSEYVTRFPTWNGWFVPEGGCTFKPYLGSDVSRCYFRGMLESTELLPEVAQNGDSYFIQQGDNHMYYYKDGEWLTYTES